MPLGGAVLTFVGGWTDGAASSYARRLPAARYDDVHWSWTRKRSISSTRATCARSSVTP